jgi:hypothetical protein
MTPCIVVSFSKTLLTAYQNIQRYNQDNGNKLINISSIVVFYLFTPPMKMEHTWCSERSAHNIQTLENHPAFTTRRKFEIKTLEYCLFCFVLFCFVCLLWLLFKRATFYSTVRHAAVHKTMHSVSFANTTFSSNNSYLLQSVSLTQNAVLCIKDMWPKRSQFTNKYVLWPVSWKLHIMRVICIHSKFREISVSQCFNYVLFPLHRNVQKVSGLHSFS